MTVEFWGTEICGTENWCAKLGDEEFCAATACTVELGAILGSPVELCSILGGNVLGVDIGDVRFLVPLSKEVNLD